MPPYKPLNLKKISSSLIPILAVAIFFFLVPHFAHAADGIGDTIMGWLGGWSGNIAGAIYYILFYIAQVILVIILFVASFILNNLLTYNIILNPSIMGPVQQGWQILRDIANGLFLIILLWLAIKIIWSIDEANSRRFIIRLIIVAFLINFSLAITGAIFGLGNALAKPFSDKMTTDVAAFIIDKTKLNTAQATPDDAGVKEVEAAFASNGKSCGFADLVDIKYADKVGCVGGNGAMAVVQGIGGFATGAINASAMKSTMQMAISDIFLLFTVITFGGAIGLLLVRIVMMVFLGVLAPAAFFLYAVPGLESQFQKWLKQVIAWAFIAPTFYFLFYISLMVLGGMTKTPILQAGSKLNFAANIFAFLPLIVFLVFMWSTMSICKRMAGPIADAAIKMGKAAAGIAVTAAATAATAGVGGLALVGAKATTGALGGQTALEGLSERRFVGIAASPLLKYNQRRADKRNERINDIKNENKNTPTAILKRKIANTYSKDKQVAWAEALHEKGEVGSSEFDKLDNDTQKKLKGYSTQLGRKALLEARVDQVTQKDVPEARDDKEAKKKVLNKMTSWAKTKISKYALKDDQTKHAIMETLTKADLEAMLRFNAEMTKELIYGFFAQNEKTLRSVMHEDTLKFIASNSMIQTVLGATRQANQAAPPVPETEPITETPPPPAANAPRIPPDDPTPTPPPPPPPTP